MPDPIALTVPYPPNKMLRAMAAWQVKMIHRAISWWWPSMWIFLSAQPGF
jgi:hypothetical protein